MQNNERRAPSGSSALLVRLPDRRRVGIERPRRARRIAARNVGISRVLELVVEARPVHLLECLELARFLITGRWQRTH